MKSEYARSIGHGRATADRRFMNLSPFDMKQLLQQVLRVGSGDATGDATGLSSSPESPRSDACRTSDITADGVAIRLAAPPPVMSSDEERPNDATGAASATALPAASVTFSATGKWLRRRRIDGALNRTPPNFYRNVWITLSRCSGGIRLAGHHLPQLPTVHEMTSGEKNFALRVERLLNDAPQPEYRQIAVELLMIIAKILERNEELEFCSTIDIDEVAPDRAVHGSIGAISPAAAAPQIIDDATAMFIAEFDESAASNASPTDAHGAAAMFTRAPAAGSVLESPVIRATAQAVQQEPLRVPGASMQRSASRQYADQQRTQEAIDAARQVFFAAPPGGKFGAATYLAKGVVKRLQSSVEVGASGCVLC